MVIAAVSSASVAIGADEVTDRALETAVFSLSGAIQLS